MLRKIKDQLSSAGWILLFSFLFLLFLPFILLWLLWLLLRSPYDYIKHKRSLYQRDYPTPFKLFGVPHCDDFVYSTLKKADLPVSYCKASKDYELPGGFFYGEILLEFQEPFFYDKKEDQWLFCPNQLAADNGEEDEVGSEEEHTDDCLSSDETVEYYRENISQNFPDVVCRDAVFFYRGDRVRKVYGKEALQKMEDDPHFVLYQKGSLRDTLEHFLRLHQ